MTSAFRLVQFVPDPFKGDRFTVAGIVRDAEGVRVHLAPMMPGASALGSAGHERLLARSLRHLEQHSEFDRLTGFGPYFWLTEAREVSTEHCDQMVRSLLDAGHQPSQTTQFRGLRRSEESWRWITRQHLDRVVRKNFQAGSGDGAFLGSAAGLNQVSQYVVGPRQFLLMEPLISREKFDQDLCKVTQRLATYSKVFQRHPDVTATPIVYGLQLSKSELRKAQSDLEFMDIGFVDTQDSLAKRRFVDQIKTVASSPMIQA